MKRQGRWQWSREEKSKLKIKQAEYRRMLGTEKIKETEK